MNPRPSTATLAWLMVPMWWLPLPAACFAYLVAGIGGQDLGALSWLQALCGAMSPYHWGQGLSMVGLAIFVLVFGVCYAVLGGINLGSSEASRPHARTALLWAATTVPLVAVTPFGMGVVAGLPAGGFSLVEGTVAANPELGQVARRAAGFLLSGLLVAAPGATEWPRQLAQGRAGEPPLPLDPGRRRRLLMGAGLGAAVLLLTLIGT